MYGTEEGLRLQEGNGPECSYEVNTGKKKKGRHWLKRTLVAKIQRRWGG